MVVFNMVFTVLTQDHNAMMRWDMIVDELLMAKCLAPLMVID